jgi:hypothetical protein
MSAGTYPPPGEAPRLDVTVRTIHDLVHEPEAVLLRMI